MSNNTNYAQTNIPNSATQTTFTYSDVGTVTTVMSQSIKTIAGALLRAQRNMGAALKDAKNPFFKSKYADLNAVREASHPALNAEGIVVLQPIVQNAFGRSFVRTLLLHESGEFIASDTEVVASKQNDPQAYGSAVSYARRYGLQSLVSLGAEDDDAERAMPRNTTSTTATTPATKPTLVAAAPDNTASTAKTTFRQTTATPAVASAPASANSPAPVAANGNANDDGWT